MKYKNVLDSPSVRFVKYCYVIDCQFHNRFNGTLGAIYINEYLFSSRPPPPNRHLPIIQTGFFLQKKFNRFRLDDKGNNNITELRTILQRESQNP
jgi:hypothetical protein